MPYLACATFPDTDHVHDAIMALEQYGVPSAQCSVLWLRAQEPDERDRVLSESAEALAPVATHATADGPVGAAGTLDPPLGEATRRAPPARGWLARLLMAEGVAADEAEELERRVLAGEVLLTVHAETLSVALDQLLSWTGAYRFKPLELFGPEATDEELLAGAAPLLELMPGEG